MLIASIGTSIIAFFLNSYYTGKGLGYTSWMQLKDVAPSYGVALVVAISIYLIKFFPISNYYILFIQIIIGTVVFFTLNELLKMQEYCELKEIAMKFLNDKKKR